MKDKTKEKLIDELVKFSQRIAELEKIKTEYKRAVNEYEQDLMKLRKTLGVALQTVAKTVEARDSYTDGHHRRVSNLARAIAQEMGLSRKDKVEGIRVSGSIHDIGKILIPIEILTKLGQLTDLEFEIIKNHPQGSYEMLKSIEFPWPVAQIVFQHHERMNGSGYPSGLSGENILLEARILGVADVVEAMSSNRIFRAAHAIDKALDEISENKSLLYDGEVVDACLRLFAQKEKGFELR